VGERLHGYFYTVVCFKIQIVVAETCISCGGFSCLCRPVCGDCLCCWWGGMTSKSMVGTRLLHFWGNGDGITRKQMRPFLLVASCLVAASLAAPSLPVCCKYVTVAIGAMQRNQFWWFARYVLSRHCCVYCANNILNSVSMSCKSQ